MADKDKQVSSKHTEGLDGEAPVRDSSVEELEWRNTHTLRAASQRLAAKGASQAYKKDSQLNRLSSSSSTEVTSAPEYEYGPVQDSGSTIIRVENIHFDVQESVLRELFEDIGPLESLRLFHDRHGRSQGLAYLAYPNASLADRAVRQFDRQNIIGQPLYLHIEKQSVTCSKIRTELLPGRHSDMSPLLFIPRECIVAPESTECAGTGTIRLIIENVQAWEGHEFKDCSTAGNYTAVEEFANHRALRLSRQYDQTERCPVSRRPATEKADKQCTQAAGSLFGADQSVVSSGFSARSGFQDSPREAEEDVLLLAEVHRLRCLLLNCFRSMPEHDWSGCMSRQPPSPIYTTSSQDEEQQLSNLTWILIDSPGPSMDKEMRRPNRQGRSVDSETVAKASTRQSAARPSQTFSAPSPSTTNLYCNPPNCGKRKEDELNVDNNRPNKKTRSQSGPSQSRFSRRPGCLYNKHDPMMYRSNAQTRRKFETCEHDFKDMSKLLEHLCRVHCDQPPQCPRCTRTDFDTSEELQAHQTAIEPCVLVTVDTVKRIAWMTHEKRKRLQLEISRNLRGYSLEDKWAFAYQWLFPHVGIADIPSPHLEDPVISIVSRFADDYEQRLRAIISQCTDLSDLESRLPSIRGQFLAQHGIEAHDLRQQDTSSSDAPVYPPTTSATNPQASIPTIPFLAADHTLTSEHGVVAYCDDDSSFKQASAISGTELGNQITMCELTGSKDSELHTNPVDNLYWDQQDIFSLSWLEEQTWNLPGLGNDMSAKSDEWDVFVDVGELETSDPEV